MSFIAIYSEFNGENTIVEQATAELAFQRMLEVLKREHSYLNDLEGEEVTVYEKVEARTIEVTLGYE